MKRYALLAVMCAMLVLAMAAVVGAQTPSEDGCPVLADGTQTVVNAAGTTCTNPNTGEIVVGTGTSPSSSPCSESSPENIYTFEGGVCVLNGEAPTQYVQPETPNTRITPDGLQYSDLPDVVPGPTEPCPLGLDQFPAGTVCGEGGGYVVPDEAPVSGSQDLAPPATETPTTATATTQTTTTALPATGGPSLALLAGGLLVAAGPLLRR